MPNEVDSGGDGGGDEARTSSHATRRRQQCRVRCAVVPRARTEVSTHTHTLTCALHFTSLQHSTAPSRQL